MARKEDIINYISDIATRNTITKEELILAYDAGKKHSIEDIKFGTLVSIILSYIGGLLLFFGLAVYSYQYFAAFSNVVFWSVILGVGITIHAVNLILSYQDKIETSIESFFYLISYLSILLGINGVLTLYKVGYSLPFALGSMTIIYLISFLFHKRDTILFYLIVSFSIILFGLGAVLISNWQLGPSSLFYLLAFMGALIITIGKLLANTARHALSPWFYILGSLLFLGAIFKVYNNQPPSILWDGIIIFMVIIMMVLGVVIFSKSIIIISSFYFVASISSIFLKFLMLESLIKTPSDMSLALALSGLAILIAVINYHILKNRFLI